MLQNAPVGGVRDKENRTEEQFDASTCSCIQKWQFDVAQCAYMHVDTFTYKQDIAGSECFKMLLCVCLVSMHATD